MLCKFPLTSRVYAFMVGLLLIGGQTIMARAWPIDSSSTDPNVNVKRTTLASPAAVNRVRFYFRNDCCTGRCANGIIQGSNDNNNWNVLHVLGAVQPQWNDVTFSNTAVYRYVRFVAAGGCYGELTELEFYEGGSRLSGTPIGTGGQEYVNGFFANNGVSWEGMGNTSRAFDGNINSLWHSNQPGGGNSAGLDLGGSGCAGPSLSLGPPTCTNQGGNTYYVSYSSDVDEVTSDAGTVDRGSRRVNNIPIGTNVRVRATRDACFTDQNATSPANCNGDPPTVDLSNIRSYVGINTNNNGPKLGEQFWLAVRGKILAEEIRVRTGWADDVFAPGYKLASLPQTERYIKSHGHLAGIPAAATVEANGIQVGEMHSLLLRKIEELTLHVIRQQKEIDQLRKRNKRRYP